MHIFNKEITTWEEEQRDRIEDLFGSHLWIGSFIEGLKDETHFCGPFLCNRAERTAIKDSGLVKSAMNFAVCISRFIEGYQMIETFIRWEYNDSISERQIKHLAQNFREYIIKTMSEARKRYPPTGL